MALFCSRTLLRISSLQGCLTEAMEKVVLPPSEKVPPCAPRPPSNLSWRCSGSKKSLKARRQKLEGMNSPNGKRTQGPNTDPAAGPDSLTFCLIGRKRGATVPTSAWSLWGERPTCREGQGLDTRAPRPFRPLLVTCVKRVQSPESLGV